MLAIRLHRSICCIFAVVMILCASPEAHAGERTITTSEQLLDRINIEDMFYTSFRSVDPQQAPAVFEQGQDHAELEKINGVWMIKRRSLTNYGIDMTVFQKKGAQERE